MWENDEDCSQKEQKHGNANNSTTNDLERSELEADLQLRMQRSLAQKVLEKSTSSEAGSFLESQKKNETLQSESVIGYSSHHSIAEMDCFKQNSEKYLQDFINSMKSGSLPNKKELDSSVSTIESFKIERSAQSTPNTYPSKLKSERVLSFGEKESSQVVSEDEFLPADQLQDRLLADEKSWKMKFGILPVHEVHEKDSDMSRFSGINASAEITIGSTVSNSDMPKRKLGADEYFRLKSNNFGSLSNKINTNLRPNFGIEMESPDQKREPVPLIDISSYKVSLGNRTKAGKMDQNELKNIQASGNENDCSSRSIISVSSIQKLMSDEEMTPRTLYKNLVNFDPKKPLKTSQDTPLPKKRVNQVKPPEDSNDNSYWIEDSGSLAFNSTTDISFQLEEDSAVKGDNESKWVSLSLLNYDDKLITGVGLCKQIFLLVENLTERKVKCELKLHKISLQSTPANDSQIAAHVSLPSRAVTIEPKDTKQAKAWIIPLIPEHIKVILSIWLEDMITNERQCSFKVIHLVGEKPKLHIAVNGVIQTYLDFGTLPESCLKQLPITVLNKGNFDVPVCISVEKSFGLSVFSIMHCKNHGQEIEQLEDDSYLKYVLKANEKKECILLFRAPALDEIGMSTNKVKLTAELKILLESSANENIVLRNFSLMGCVGRTKLLLMKRSIPVVLSSNQFERTSQSFSLLNDGIVPLNLSFRIVNDEFEEVADDVVSVEPNWLVAPPNQRISVNLFFSPLPVTTSVNRYLFIQIEPDGQQFKVQIFGNVTGCEENVSIKEDPIQISRVSSTPIECSPNRNSEEGTIDSRKLSGDSTASTALCPSRSKTPSLSFPIATTRKELVWCSVPVGQQVKESFMLRNEGPNTIKLQISLQDTSSSFKILTEQQKTVKELKTVLQSMERVKLSIVFEPLKPGAAYDKVTFRKYPPQESAAKFVLPLYAYGGHHRVAVKGVPKDGCGRMWFCIGALDLGKTLMEAYFIISNSGTLDAFAVITATTKGLELLNTSAITVDPNELIIPAKSSTTVKIIYKAQKEQLKYLATAAKEITEIGVLSILTGDEPSRQRLRRACNNIMTKKSFKSSGCCSNMSLSNICKSFPQEKLIPELEQLKDPEDAIDMLCSSLICQDVSLTIEKSGEKTYDLRSCLGSDYTASQSQIFTSLYSEGVDESLSSFGDAVSETGSQSSLWTVSAESIVLLPPKITGGCVQIFSKSRSPQIFEAQINNKLLIVSPSQGIVPPRGEITITVSCCTLSTSRCKDVEAVLKIFLENDMRQIRVVIKYGT